MDRVFDPTTAVVVEARQVIPVTPISMWALVLALVVLVIGLLIAYGMK